MEHALVKWSDHSRSPAGRHHMRSHDDDGIEPHRHRWWSDTDVADLKEPDALARFIDNCDFHLEPSKSNGEDDGSYASF